MKAEVTLVAIAVVTLTALRANAEPCIVCGEEVDEPAITVEYRGRDYPLHNTDEKETWDDAAAAGSLDSIVASVEPRGALFQGDSRFLNPRVEARDALSDHGLAIGIWALLAILSGGVSAGLAVTRHRPPLYCFLCATILPVVGIASLFLAPRREDEFDMRGHKIPKTHDEASCPGCGRSNHPSAVRCAGCGSALTPSTESEVTKI